VFRLSLTSPAWEGYSIIRFPSSNGTGAGGQPGHCAFWRTSSLRHCGCRISFLQGRATRAIEAVLDERPVVTAAQIELARIISTETLSPLNSVLFAMLPPGLSQQADVLYTWIGPEEVDETRATEKALARLLKRRGPLRGRQIDAALPNRDWRAVARRLVRQGVLRAEPDLPAEHPAGPGAEPLPANLDLARPHQFVVRARAPAVSANGPEPFQWLWFVHLLGADPRVENIRLLRQPRGQHGK